ncbi:MAG: phospholipase D-like domain-containing protein [Desulfomonilaceae bacterium]
MFIPYVIDNQIHTMGEVLAGLLKEHEGRCLDIATAYFNVGGFEQIKDGLLKLGNLRLILGSEPTLGKHLGLEPKPEAVNGQIRGDLEDLPFDEKTLRSVEDLITFLQAHAIQVRLHRKGFLHAKCWIFYADRPGKHNLYDRFRPMVAIVGSSNFTRAGLTSNKELNLSHKVLVDSSEAEDAEARNAVGWLIDEGVVEKQPVSHQQSLTVEQPTDSLAPYEEVNRLRSDRQLIKSEVGARAILDLEKWFEGR